MMIHVDVKTLVSSLRSDICPACGMTKACRQTLCAGCYRSLPRGKQVALYDRVGNGYQEAVVAALQHLGVTEFKLKPEAPK